MSDSIHPPPKSGSAATLSLLRTVQFEHAAVKEQVLQSSRSPAPPSSSSSLHVSSSPSSAVGSPVSPRGRRLLSQDSSGGSGSDWEDDPFFAVGANANYDDDTHGEDDGNEDDDHDDAVNNDTEPGFFDNADEDYPLHGAHRSKKKEGGGGGGGSNDKKVNGLRQARRLQEEEESEEKKLADNNDSPGTTGDDGHDGAEAKEEEDDDDDDDDDDARRRPPDRAADGDSGSDMLPMTQDELVKLVMDADIKGEEADDDFDADGDSDADADQNYGGPETDAPTRRPVNPPSDSLPYPSPGVLSSVPSPPSVPRRRREKHVSASLAPSAELPLMRYLASSEWGQGFSGVAVNPNKTKNHFASKPLGATTVWSPRHENVAKVSAAGKDSGTTTRRKCPLRQLVFF